MFGRFSRKDKEPAQQQAASAPPPRFGGPAGIGNLATVIVPRSAAERATDPDKAYELVQAVINFVNFTLGEGLYSRFEIPAKAMQAYHADFYLAQVNNGGHSQFIHNSHRNLEYILADVRAGLTGMKAKSHLLVMEQMAAWVAQHPDEASQQTGFQGGRAEHLDDLDKRFYAADKAMPMIRQSAHWIASWPELKIVDDADHREALRRIAVMNPLREARLVSRSVANLSQQMTTWFHVGVGLACAGAPRTEIKLAIGGGSVMEIEGEKQTVFHVRTNASEPRFCVVTNEHAAAYECIEADNPPMPAIGDVEGLKQAMSDGRLARFKGPSVGKKLSRIEAKTIAGVIELANEYRAPAALDLLLRKAGIAPDGAAVAPLSIEPKPGGMAVYWLLAAGGQALFALTAPSVTALFRPDDDRPLATLRKPEIDEHAARVEAGTVKPA